MEEVSIIGIDLAKRSFQVHGAKADGSVAYRRKLSRGKLLSFLASQRPCTVAMEACASAHYWGREIAALGHEVRLVPPIYVKPFVKRHKNDAADAEAITEAAQRPTMHFVAVKTEAQQAQGMLFRTRDLLVRQRTQTINALRGHLAEYGVVAPQGRARIGQLAGVLEDGDCGLPEAVVERGDPRGRRHRSPKSPPTPARPGLSFAISHRFWPTNPPSHPSTIFDRPPYPGSMDSVGADSLVPQDQTAHGRVRSRQPPRRTKTPAGSGFSRSLKHTVGSPARAASPQLEWNDVTQRLEFDVFDGTGQHLFHLLLLLVYQCGQRLFEPFPVAQFV